MYRVCGINRVSIYGREVCTREPHGADLDPEDPGHRFELARDYWQKATTALAEEIEQRRAERQSTGQTLGRALRQDWQEVDAIDPDAWRDRADDRPLSPPAGQPLPKDVDGYPAGAGEGRASMASIAEVKAAAGAIVAGIAEAQGILHSAIERIGQEQQLAAQLLQGTGHEAAVSAVHGMQGMVNAIEDAQRAGEMAIEQLNAYCASF